MSKGTMNTNNNPASPKDHVSLPPAHPPTPNASIHLLPSTQPVTWLPLWAHLTSLLGTISLTRTAVDSLQNLLLPSFGNPRNPIPGTHNHSLAGLWELR